MKDTRYRNMIRIKAATLYLFVSKRVTVIAAATARGIIVRAGKTAELSLSIHPHMLATISCLVIFLKAIASVKNFQVLSKIKDENQSNRLFKH